MSESAVESDVVQRDFGDVNKQCAGLHTHPDSMGGAKRFPDTRVPVSLLFLNLRDGVTIDEFCKHYGRVSPEACRAVLTDAEALIEHRQELAIEQEVSLGVER